MKKLIVLLLLCLCGFTFGEYSFAQGKKTASGVVISAEDNLEIIGAAVTVKGRPGIGTVTDVDGHFSLDVPTNYTTLVVSYIGMLPVEIPVKENQRIVMKTEARELGDVEVVTTGIATQDKRMFTGAAAKVEAEEIQLAGMGDISRSLEGRVTGVQVTNVSGTFGTAPKIRVRGATSIYGSSSPLWVIDGVIYESSVEVSADDLSSGNAETLISSAVAGLNQDDIESFTILKDGSATSIYGARAMAGVIVVTTKKGKKGHAQINYTGEFTYRRKPSYNDYNVMNSQEIMGVYREMEKKGWLQLQSMANGSANGVYGYMYQQIRKYNESDGQFGLANTEAAKNAYLQKAEFRNTDWFDLLYNNNVMMNHSISISGGTDKSQNYFSMSIMDDPGWTDRSSVRRYTFNGNTSYDLLPNLTFKLSASGSHIDQQASGGTDKSIDVVTGDEKRDFDNNVFSYALSTSRCLDPNFTYTRFYTDYNIFDELRNNYNDIDNNEIKFQAELTYKPINKVTINALVGLRYTKSRRVQNVMDNSNQANAYRAGTDAIDDNSTIRYANTLLYTDPDDPDALPVSVLPEGGIKYQDDRTMRSETYRIQAAYNDVFNEKHILNAMAGAEMLKLKRTANRWTGWGYQYDYGMIINTPYLWLKQINEENSESNFFYDTFSTTNTVATFATASYSYDYKYTINGTFRYDGTNRLGKTRQARWLPTYNVSGAYNIYDEDFMESTKSWLSGLNLRLSYSLTADTGPSSVTNATTIYGTEVVWRPNIEASESQIYIRQQANTELTFEKKHEYNIGLDFSILNERISFILDWYKRKEFDDIGLTYTQGAGGEIAKWANVADMESGGFEVGVGATAMHTKKFHWSVNFNYSLAKNTITNLRAGGTRAIDLLTGSGYHLEDYPRAALFSYKFAGLNEEGLPMVYNESGLKTDGKEAPIGDVNMQNTKDLQDYLIYEGPSDPTYFGSLDNNFRYNSKIGDWTLGIYITYAGGNAVRLDPVFSYAYSDLSTLPREFKNRWVVPGDELKTTIPAIASRMQVDRIGSYDVKTAYNAYNYSTVRTAHGDFGRLKEVSLTYAMPKSWLEKAKIASCSLKLATTNLSLLWADKKLNGQDPEFVNAGGVASPLSKQFTGTLRIGF